MSDTLISDKSAGRQRNVNDQGVAELEAVARQLRRHVITMLAAAGSGHPGGSLSAADIVTALFFRHMRHDPTNPEWPERDRFILSKGHAAPILYAALSESGYFPSEQLTSLRRLGSCLQGHPSRRDLPIVEASTGSLGQGLSMGIGMALAGKLDHRQYRVYVLLGDGEAQEGQVWEAAMAAGKFKLDNLTAVLDNNRFQLDGRLGDIMELEPVVDKWRSFGWNVTNVNGHDITEILGALHQARSARGRPSIIVARTVKGKGVSFMENDNEFHGKAPTSEQAELALRELE